VAERDGWGAAWVRTEADARAVLDAGCYYDADAADRVVNFFHKLLRHSTGEWAGKPFRLLEWQEHRLIRPLFGWKRKDGTRRHRRGGVWIPKKNGKTTLSAGIEAYLLMADREPAAEVMSAANDRKQAGIVFKQLRRMIESSPQLLKRIGRKNIIPSTKTIYDPTTGSTYTALSADGPTNEGWDIHGLVIDEIHAMKSRTLWDTLIYGGSARRQPLMLSISTAGVYDPATIGWEQYEYAKRVLDGTNHSDWAFFSLVYEAAESDDWTLEATWQKANPSFGFTVKADKFAEECQEAQQEPRKQNNFLRYRLNRWVQQVTRWITQQQWSANHAQAVKLGCSCSYAGLEGRICDAGLDLGSVSDITALALTSECEHDHDALDVLMWFWVPEDALSNPRNRNRDLYQQWVKSGHLLTTPGTTTNHNFIEAEILKIAEHVSLRSLAMDRLFQGQQLELNLKDHGIDVYPLGQGYMSQGPPMKEFERLWRSLQVHHGDHPVLNWMADNVEVKPDPAGSLKIFKPNNHNDPRKVDGIQALVNAIDRNSRYNTAESAYDADGAEIFAW
jgi:phage terminase large subunit-like protein